MERIKSNDYIALATEAEEQAALFRYASCELPRYPMLDTLVHVPNGGYRHNREAARLKAQGVRRGYPDILLDYPACGKHGLRIELKRVKDYHIEREQKQWIYKLNVNGYAAVFCFGWRHAWEVIEAYITGDRARLEKEISVSLSKATGGRITKLED